MVMENKKELRTWLDDFQLNHPLVIAGPCSAETEDQVLKIAHELKNSDVSIFRAGIWKPRTRPGGFEGVGASVIACVDASPVFDFAEHILDLVPLTIEGAVMRDGDFAVGL